jgi:SAM-dependent methyltransferase
MMSVTAETDIKRQVRQFYDQVGWQEIGEGIYQNAQYEDLRPVSREYIHRCHLRVGRHLQPTGKYFLDAGSGPIQYPEYLEYSKGYRFRVCADISIVALQEARKRIGDAQAGGHGLFVVADVAHLPFQSGVFDGLVSLHTIHHLPGEEQPEAFFELHRMLGSGKTGVVVNGWEDSLLSRFFVAPIKFIRRTWKRVRRRTIRSENAISRFAKKSGGNISRGTYVRKNSPEWLKREIGSRVPLEIYVWRSVNVRFLRTYIHGSIGGKYILRVLFSMEEKFPRLFGEKGQYPLIVIKKV